MPLHTEREHPSWMVCFESRWATVRRGRSSRSRVATAIVGLAVVPLLVTGCNSASSSGSDNSKPVRGGDLTIANDQDIQTLDKTRMFHNEDIWMSEQFFETLYAAAPDGKSLVPRLATSYNLSPDKKTWTFNLRHGVKFTTGKPMTADDVVFSIDDARGKTSLWASLDAAIQSVTAKDKYTVVIKTKYPWSPLLSDLALFSNGIVPKDFGGVSKKQFFTKPVGTGPFKFVTWKKGQYVKAVRNPYYWQQGRPYLDSVTWKDVPDANTRVLQVQGGQADIGEFPPWSSIKSLQSSPTVKVDLFPSSRTDYLAFNTRRKPFDDAHVRRAISYALDRKSMIQAVLFGHGDPANALLTPALWAHDSSLQGDEFSLTKAKAEMAKSSSPSGFSTTLTVDPGDNTQVTLSQLIQQELKPLGINLSVNKDSNASTDTENFNYDMAFTYDTTDIIDPDELVVFSAVGNGGTHSLFTGYNSARVNSLAAQAAHVFDQSKRKQLYAKIQSQVATDAPLIPLYYSPFVYVQTDKVHSFNAYTIGYYPLQDVYKSK
jgi:peptide/nickel transport system substrate-binding protein